MSEEFNKRREDHGQSRLIFDLGMHRGADTRFYLSKGYKVVAVEANPYLVEAAREQFKHEIKENQLVIVDRALWQVTGVETIFFLSDNDVWSSLTRAQAEKMGATSREIKVRTTTLSDLFLEFGTPYYIKCDMEGGDDIAVSQISSGDFRPPFVSIEISSNAAEVVARMFCAGYDRMQVINQATHHQREVPNPSREGVYAPLPSGMISGLFGRDLPPGNWTNLQATVVTIALFQQLWPRMHIGWADVHFSSVAVLGS